MALQNESGHEDADAGAKRSGCKQPIGLAATGS